MKILERCVVHENEMTISTSNVYGTIKELMKKCGFINILDDKLNSKKNDVILFLIDGANCDDKQQLRKGDAVRFDISTALNGKRLAVNVTNRYKKTDKSGNQSYDKNICLGVILLEPSLTTLKNTPIRKASSNASIEKAGRWETGDDSRNKSSDDLATDLGCIVLTSDPGNVFGMRNQSIDTDEDEASHVNSMIPIASETTLNASTNGLYQHLQYRTSSYSTYQPGSMMTNVAKSITPRRGDLVSFVKVKNAASPKSTNNNDVAIRELRLITKGAALLIRGKLEWLTANEGSNASDEQIVRFLCDDGTTYDSRVSEIVSCDPMQIKDQECVEGILYEGRVFGIARLTDLYIESKYSGANNTERPKLNLTVKKDLGGKIVAQSMMAKGPDGTNGFAPGWTNRISRFLSVVDTRTELKVDAPEFTPSQPIN